MNASVSHSESSASEDFKKSFSRRIEAVTAAAARVAGRVSQLRDTLYLNVNDVGHPALAQFIKAHQNYLSARLSSISVELGSQWADRIVEESALFEEIDRVQLFIDLIGLHHIEPCIDEANYGGSTVKTFEEWCLEMARKESGQEVRAGNFGLQADQQK